MNMARKGLSTVSHFAGLPPSLDLAYSDARTDAGNQAKRRTTTFCVAQFFAHS